MRPSFFGFRSGNCRRPGEEEIVRDFCVCEDLRSEWEQKNGRRFGLEVEFEHQISFTSVVCWFEKESTAVLS